MQEVAYLWARLWVSCHSVPPCWMLYSWCVIRLLRISHVLLSVFTLSSAYYLLLEYKVHVFPLQQRAWVDALHLHSCCPVKAVCVWVVVCQRSHHMFSDKLWHVLAKTAVPLILHLSYVNALAWLRWSFHGVIRKNLCFWFHIWSFVLNISYQLKRSQQKIETDPMYFLNTFLVLLCTILMVFLTISAVCFP